MFRDLYSTKVRVHNLRPTHRSVGSPHPKRSNHQSLTALAQETMQTLGNFPPERQLLYHHPLNGFEELAFIEALDLLHRLTGARVWPSVAHTRKLFEDGVIKPIDWAKSYQHSRSRLGFETEIAFQESLEQFLNADEPRMASYGSSLASPALILDKALGSGLYGRILASLSNLMADYARARLRSQARAGLWEFAAERSWLAAGEEAFDWSRSPEATVCDQLELMAIPRALWKDYFLQAAWSLPGWSSWLKSPASPAASKDGSHEFLSWLALRSRAEFACVAELGRQWGFAPHLGSVQSWSKSREAALRAKGAPAVEQPPEDAAIFALQALALEAREEAWRRRITERITAKHLASAPQDSPRAAMQGLFCIDSRCEPIRCAWEKQSQGIETFSAPGAFSLRPRHIAAASYPNTAELAENLLRQFGAHPRFARLVLICGHSHPHPDPWCSGFLECTACGGRSGSDHAQHAAQLLNDEGWRARLSLRGISIPDDTCFIAGLYRTDLHEVLLIDASSVPPSHREDLDRLRATLAAAHRELQSSSPEQGGMGGASGNAGFLIGPRALHREIDLQGSCFMHSYDGTNDDEALQLAQIFQGALSVALSINLQYYFSAVDPLRWSAGSMDDLETIAPAQKLRASDKDLARGLPTEALLRTRTFHEPMRLQVLVVARRDQVLRALSRSERAAKAWRAQWFSLTVINPHTREAQLLTPFQEDLL